MGFFFWTTVGYLSALTKREKVGGVEIPVRKYPAAKKAVDFNHALAVAVFLSFPLLLAINLGFRELCLKVIGAPAFSWTGTTTQLAGAVWDKYLAPLPRRHADAP